MARPSKDSPVSNNGRGLKHAMLVPDWGRLENDSPVSNNGRGLKPRSTGSKSYPPCDSPVSNNGRGLKQEQALPERHSARGFAR